MRRPYGQGGSLYARPSPLAAANLGRLARKGASAQETALSECRASNGNGIDVFYAVDADSPQHARARRWLERTLSGDVTVGVPWIAALAFLRITTRAGVLRRQLSAEHAIAFIDEWLAQPYVELIGPGAGHWPLLKRLLRDAGAAGNLTSDAHLAALAIEGGWELATTDHDFRRFAGIRLVNPLAVVDDEGDP